MNIDDRRRIAIDILEARLHDDADEWTDYGDLVTMGDRAPIVLTASRAQLIHYLRNGSFRLEGYGEVRVNVPPDISRTLIQLIYEVK